MLVVRLVSLAGMAAVLSRVAPCLRFGLREVRIAHIRRLISPALAVIALPAAFAVSLQGVVLVVGALLSLNAVAVFSTVRTLTRAVIQAGGIVNHAIMPEVTRAFGVRDFPRLRRLMRFNLMSVVTLNAAAFVIVAVFGSRIVNLWTRGRIEPESILVIGLAAVASLHSLWLSQANLILAVNRHGSYSYWFLLVSIVSTLAAIPAIFAFGFDGVLPPLLLAECVMILIVARAFYLTFGGLGHRANSMTASGIAGEQDSLA
jgi:O-antigen/teichoic acid export membrane protein